MLREARDEAEARYDALTDVLAAVPVGEDGALTDERKAAIAAALGYDPFAGKASEDADDDAEEPVPLPDEARAAIMAAMEHARATLGVQPA